MKIEIAKLFASNGILLEPGAAEYVMEQPNPMGFVKELLPALKQDNSCIVNCASLRSAREKNGISKAIEKGKKRPDLKARTGSASGIVIPTSLTDSIPRNVGRRTSDFSNMETEAIGELHPGKDGEAFPIRLVPRDAKVKLQGESFPEDSGNVQGYAPKYVDVMPQVTVMRDITGESLCEGKKENFFTYFSARFEKMKSILRRNSGVRNVMPISMMKKRGQYHHNGNEKVSVIGMVADIRMVKNDKRIVTLEDETGRLKGLIGNDGNDASNNGLVMDETVAFTGKMARDRDLFYIDSIVQPGAPWGRQVNRADEEIYAAFISDIHAGSNTFLTGQWESFIKWLGGGFREQMDIVNRIKYLVINGDNVDGIGIYPKQKYDLAVADIYEQYHILGEYLKMIPGHIEVIMIPGNHDAVRRAEPQPAMMEEMTKYFPSNVTVLGNPSYFRLHGTIVLAYHGTSIDDWITALNHLNYTNPIESMKEMMIRRHMLPMYGMKTPLAPEKDDHLVIDPIPDIFITGHTHSFGTLGYRNTLLINGSTWQSQTDYQKMHNFDPIPAKVTAVNLNTLGHTVIDFMDSRPVLYTGG